MPTKKLKKRKLQPLNNQVSVFLKIEEIVNKSSVDPYGDWYQQHELTGVSARIYNGIDEPPWPTRTVECEFKPKVGQKIYIVIEEYQTGDTFGHSEGNFSVDGIFQTEKDALFFSKNAIGIIGYFDDHTAWHIKEVILT